MYTCQKIKDHTLVFLTPEIFLLMKGKNKNKTANYLDKPFRKVTESKNQIHISDLIFCGFAPSVEVRNLHKRQKKHLYE